MEGFNKISTIIALSFAFIFVVVMITFASTTNKAVYTVSDSIDSTIVEETQASNVVFASGNGTDVITLTTGPDVNKLMVTIYANGFTKISGGVIINGENQTQNTTVYYVPQQNVKSIAYAKPAA